ncbi:hypothetical protein [Acanthopleuribacter pedis]|uniref:Uncharacterized protein n=1 Tax=Acanthopleuribacter pedis TaxID=442870 RepID=A0A8J7U584_9BACT|nr:hypothetical protein [Acanthopleuribacter pedis]MBO1320579.1 hypothetical protein [Acanthopleuribacter pedis]
MFQPCVVSSLVGPSTVRRVLPKLVVGLFLFMAGLGFATEPRADKSHRGPFWEGRVPASFEEIGIEQSGATGGKLTFEGIEVAWVFHANQHLQFYTSRGKKSLIATDTQLHIHPDLSKVAMRGDVTGDGKPELILMAHVPAREGDPFGQIRCAVFQFSEQGAVAQVVYLTTADHRLPIFADLNKNGDVEWVQAIVQPDEKEPSLKIGALWFTSTLTQATPLQLSQEQQKKYPKITGGLQYDTEYATFNRFEVPAGR